MELHDTRPRRLRPAGLALALALPALVAGVAAPAEEEETMEIRRAGAEADGMETRMARARRSVARGDHDRAMATLDQVLEEVPGHAAARKLSARIHHEAGREERALATLEASLKTEAPDPELVSLKARILLESGRAGPALAILDAHPRPLESDADHHLLRAAALRQLGEHDAAREGYDALVRLHPDRGRAWAGLGLSLEALGQRRDAAAAYENAVSGDDPDAARFARQRLLGLPPADAAPEPEAEP